MSKETHNKIVAKLDRLDEYLGYLADVQTANEKDFVKDYHLYGLAERYLQLSIEVLLDVGKLLVILARARRPEDNQDVFVSLHEKEILSEELANRLLGIANFRNILVHEYEDIDRSIVFSRLQKNMDDFRSFKSEVATYLAK